MQKKYKSMLPVLLYVAGAFLCLFILTNKYPPKKCGCSHDHGHKHTHVEHKNHNHTA